MRKFRPLQESIDICTKMLLKAMYYGEDFPLLESVNSKIAKEVNEVEYWVHRRNGYAKLAGQKGIPVQVTKVEQY